MTFVRLISQWLARKARQVSSLSTSAADILQAPSLSAVGDYDAVWLYARFTLSFRDVEEMLAERGIDVSNETVRRWFLKFGRVIVSNLRQSRPTSSVPMALPFERNAYRPFMIRGSEQTIRRRTHINPCDDENVRCSGSSHQDLLNVFSRSKPPSKTPSPSNATSSHAASSSSFAQGRFLSGGRAAFPPDCGHRGVWSTAAVNVSMPGKAMR